MSSAAEYWVGPTIGEGAFGHVVYAVHKATEQKLAIKVVEVPTTVHASRETRQHYQNQHKQKTAMILNERRILSLPELKSSRWIIDLCAAFCGSTSSSRYLYFVMELATGGDLRGLIHQGLSSHVERRSWLGSSVPFYASQLIAAVEFLHSEGVLHCDLKPENVLLDATRGHLKLADFGCALDTTQQLQQQEVFPRGTTSYSSPEILRVSRFTVAVDYWSVGCILHAMVHGQSPFDRGSEALTVRAVFAHVAARGGTTEESGVSPLSASSDEYENDKKLVVVSSIVDHAAIEDSTIANPTNAITPAGTIAENEDRDDPDPLQLLWQDLLAVVPDNRIGAWKDSALPFLASQSHGDFGDGDALPPSEKESQLPVPNLASQNILLPVPKWQDQVDNATLRDGGLGWSVFQL